MRTILSKCIAFILAFLFVIQPLSPVFAQEASTSAEVAPSPTPPDWSETLSENATSSATVTPSPFATDTPMPAVPSSTPLPSTPTPTLTPSVSSMPSATMKLPMKLRQLARRTFQLFEYVDVEIESDPAVTYSAMVTDSGGSDAGISVSQVTIGQKRYLRLTPTNRLRPGRHTLKVSDWTGKTITQNFTWGVLALNTSESVYTPGDTAELLISVLDETGKMVCDAKLTLAIRKPDGSTDTLSTGDKAINVTPECSQKNISSDADYIATYNVNQSGTYQLTLKAETGSGTYTIEDELQVRETVPFTVKRTMPSRLYPVGNEEAVITITANQDFSGEIVETVPDVFDTASSSATPYDWTASGVATAERLVTNSDSPQAIRYPFDGNYPQTLGFGENVDDDMEKIQYQKYGLAGHDGVDFDMPEGTPVIAVDDGEVMLAGKGAYGVTVVLQHQWGRSYYGHLQGTGLNVGQKVLKGYKIGLSGSTGLATGPHLHFGIKLTKFDSNNGYFGKVDPLPYLTGTSVYPRYGVRLIGWKATLKKGETRKFRYVFDAPDVSPQFYGIGPVRFLTTDTKKAKSSDNPFVLGLSTQKRTTYTDSRIWQIAVDAVEPSQAQNSSEPPEQAVAAEHTVIAKGKPVNTNLRENARALALSRGDRSARKTPDEQLFRWEVELPNKTRMGFGQQEEDGVVPAVKIQNKEGWFVSFEPQNAVRVTPSVSGNEAQWDIVPGVTAKYKALSDRIKADYRVVSASALLDGNKLKFTAHYNDEYSGDFGEELINGKGYLTHEMLPDGSIAWLGESGGTAFTNPIPIIKDANGKEFKGRYEITKVSQGTSQVTIVLPQSQLAGAVYPLTVDPVTIDSSATSTSTAYGNARQLLRDPYGNLVALIEGGSTDDVYYKNYNVETWSDAGITISGTNSVAADFDGQANNENIHVAYVNTVDSDLEYVKLTVNRGADNTISSISLGTPFNIDTSDKTNRPSVIITNKGEGAGKEKIALAWALNSTSGGTKRGNIRFLQCDVADLCDATSEWKNASEEKDGNTNGMPSALDTPGAADVLFAITSGHTTHHAVLTQVPGGPARTPSPTSVKFYDFNTDTYSNLSNTIDDNTGTSDNFTINAANADFLYIGDDTKFSRVVVDIATGDGGSETLTYNYWNGSSWTALSNVINNAGTTFSEDGSLLFDEPSDWSTTAVDGVTRYWIRISSSTGGPNVSPTVAEFDVTDRHSKDLLIVGGNDDDDDLRSAYVIWDFVGQAGWENIPGNTTAPAPWRLGATGSLSLNPEGTNWATLTNFPLTITADYITNRLYIAYVCDGDASGDAGCAVGSFALNVELWEVNNSLTDASKWDSTSFPSVTEAADIVLSLTSNQNDIYLFYVLDPGTNNLEWSRCNPRGGGAWDVCDAAADWPTTPPSGTLVNFAAADEIQSHPKAVVSKAYGDITAIDVIYTDTNDVAVEYERHYVDNVDKTIVVAASGDDGRQQDCDSGTDDQDINLTLATVGGTTSNGNCVGSVGSLYHAGFRFPSIPIDPGTTISSAYFDFVITLVNGSTDVDFTVYGEDVDDAALFSSLTNVADDNASLIKNLSRTTTSSIQAIDFQLQRYRIDVTDMVQEIICRGAGTAQPCVGNYNDSGSWASGNDLALLLISNEGIAATNLRNIATFDSTAAIKPTLQINVSNSGKRYSSGVVKTPTTKTDLDHPFSMDDITWTNNDDSMFASVSASLVPSASSSATPIFMFKANNSNNNNTDDLSATAIVKSTIPTKSYGGGHTSGRTIYLQLYHTTNGWETKASNTTTAPDTEITLSSGTVTGSSSYYATESPGGSCTGSDCWAAWRIYQDAAPEANQVLSVDTFSATFTSSGPTLDQLLRHGGWFNSSGVEQPFTF